MKQLKKDPLDEIILTKEQTKWFNTGKKQGHLEAIREAKKTPKPKLTIDQNRLLLKLEEHGKRIKYLEEMLAGFKQRYLNADKRVASIMGMKELETYPKLKKKILRKATKVFDIHVKKNIKEKSK